MSSLYSLVEKTALGAAGPQHRQSRKPEGCLSSSSRSREQRVLPLPEIHCHVGFRLLAHGQVHVFQNVQVTNPPSSAETNLPRQVLASPGNDQDLRILTSRFEKPLHFVSHHTPAGIDQACAIHTQHPSLEQAGRSYSLPDWPRTRRAGCPSRESFLLLPR